jgi:hypothetical protein
MNQNKTSKYFKYAIGEIVLVVIGILIALSINNWNENQKEKKQIRNIYARVVKDFENSALEIDSMLKEMDATIPLIQKVVREEVDRDSLITDFDYLRKYFNSATGFPDIQIQDKGVRMLESKIGTNYEFSTEYSETLFLLYSEFLYEIEVDEVSLTKFLAMLNEYQASRGVRPARLVNNGINRIVDMVFDDDVYKNHLFNYMSSFINFRNKLKRFKTQGTILIDKVKAEYNLG